MNAAMDSVGLLLIGRTGNGKSSTGNSILDSKTFLVSSSGNSKVTEPSKGTTTINGRTVNVVDGIDIGDKDDVESLTRMAKKTFGVMSAGITAFLLVLKYGVRFTKQDQDAVRLIRSVFGPDVFIKRGVIVVSHGDNFDQDMESAGRSGSNRTRNFKDWCDEQIGNVRDLFDECGSRVVLFDNKAKHDSREMKNQVSQLMSEVSKIESNSPYTRKDLPDPRRWRWLITNKNFLYSIVLALVTSGIAVGVYWWRRIFPRSLEFTTPPTPLKNR